MGKIIDVELKIIITRKVKFLIFMLKIFVIRKLVKVALI